MKPRTAAKSSAPTVVLGAGAAGMQAAWELARHGRDVVVLDREALPGGLCRTFEHEGHRFDLGGHRFISRDSALVDQVKALLGDDLLEPTRKSAILLHGKRYRYPLEPLDIARNLDPLLGARGFVDYVVERVRQRVRGGATPASAGAGAEQSFRDWTLPRYGKTFYDLFFGPYTEKLWGIPAHTLAGDWASQRISLLDLSDVALRLVGLRRGGARTYARGYYYPRRGIGQIFTAMSASLRARGAQIRQGCQVVGLGRDGERVREVRFIDGDGHEQRLPCDSVISTLALPDLARMLYPEDSSIGAAADQLRFRAVRFLCILLDQQDVSQFTWQYVPDPRCLFTRIQEPKRRSPESAPAGKTSLMLEIPCDEGDAVWSQSDETLLDRCLRDLALLGYDLAPVVRGCFSTRITQGYPVFRLGYQRPRDGLLDAVGAFDNLISCGRQGTYRYIFMDTAMQMGQLAAQQCMQRRLEPATFVDLHAEPTLLETQALTA